MHWRSKWQPTPLFFPGECQGRRSLVGCHLWGHIELDMTEVTYQQGGKRPVLKNCMIMMMMMMMMMKEIEDDTNR